MRHSFKLGRLNRAEPVAQPAVQLVCGFFDPNYSRTLILLFLLLSDTLMLSFSINVIRSNEQLHPN